MATEPRNQDKQTASPSPTVDRSAAERQLAEGREAQARAVQETEERINNSRPTPTQEENDRAKLGILDIDSKEDDGAESEADAFARRARAAADEAQRNQDAQRASGTSTAAPSTGSAPYKNRASETK